MDPVESSEVQAIPDGDDMQREIPETFGEATSGTENATANKGLCGEVNYNLESEEENTKVEGVVGEVNDVGFQIVLAEDSQEDNTVTLDMLVGLQQLLEDFIGVGSVSLCEDPRQALTPSTLGVLGYEQSRLTEDFEDVDKAIEHWGRASGLLASPDVERLGPLNNLGCAYQTRFELLGEVSDLNKAIEFVAEAVSLTPDGHPDKPGYLNTLGDAYTTRFGRLGELSDLIIAIECQAQAISLTPDDHPDRPAYLNSLGVSQATRFGRLGEIEDLNKGIESQAEAVSITPDGHPDRPGRLSTLGLSYTARFERLGELSDLKKAIESQAQAVSLTPDDHPRRPERLNGLGISYTVRFERLGEPSDVNKAIECQERAVSLAPDCHPDRAGYLNCLGLSYTARFAHLGELTDLNKAVESQQEAVSLTHDNHPFRPGYLNGLGSSYATRFERLGELSDLNKAIESQAQAVSLTPDDHPYKPACLNNLGNSYTTRFRPLGELGDLNKAIECQAQAVSLTPDGHPDRPAYLNNLGSSYGTRFNRLGELTDLNNAIECQAQAILLNPYGHPSRPAYLYNLGILYTVRLKRLGELTDLSQAIDSHTQAVLLTPDGHPDRPLYLNSLGSSYKTRFSRLGELIDLSAAIESHAQAVSLTPSGHPDRPGYLNNLGLSYGTRFEHLSELSDLNKTIECQERAISLTPDGHPYRAERLKYLGISYTTRFERLGEMSDLQSAGSSLECASKSPTGPPSVRFGACRQWVRLSLFDPKFSPLPAYQQAMSLIPQLVWIGTTIGRRYELVAEVSAFAAEAASYAISTGAYNLALEWLEAGRSIVWGQISQLRSPFDDLSCRHPKLAEGLASVGRQLEHVGSRSPLTHSPKASDPDLGREASTHIQLALEWDRLLKEIRSMPGFKDFLSSPTAGQLLRAAKAHPVVMINLHESRCDALVLQPNVDTVSHLALPNFSYKDAISARDQVFSQVRSRRPGPPLNRLGALQSSLENLWTGAIKPVLDFLGYTRKLPVNQLPHLTWCTTGLLSFLPLHTARSHDESQPGTFDLVVSSYTPTLSALLSSQSADPRSACGILAVGQENTPGLTSLPCTTSELAVIKKHARSDSYLQLENDEATVEQVLDAMDQFSWVHMACHGIQDPHDPTHSAFHLHDGNLTLAAITRRSFANKGLAFLSACQTATGDKNMPDEAVHLSAGMLMAGYPSVIGTMWSIADEDGPEVADLVYAELLKDGKMDHTKSARALHQAVARLREKVGEKDIARWAPFIHIGC